MASSSSSPCAACKFLRRKCTQECVFAPYFPPDQPQKFSFVHRVFGASNVAKLLNELSPNQREDAVNSLFYEAEARLRDPVYGCVGLISILQHRLKQLNHDLENAKKELATYSGSSSTPMLPTLLQPLQPQHFMSLQRPSSSSTSASVMTHQQNMLPMMAIPTGQMFLRDHYQQQLFESQQLAVQQNEMFRAFGGGGSNQDQQQSLLRFSNNNNDINNDNNRFDSVPTGSVTVTGFNTGAMSSPSLALGGNFVDDSSTPSYHHHHHHLQHHEAQLFVSQPQPLQTQETHETQTNSESEEGRRSVIG